MNTSYNSLREDKTNTVSAKGTSDIEATVHLYCDSGRQSHNHEAHVQLAASFNYN